MNLTEDQRRELADANARARKIFGAVKVATFNGWTIGVFAAIGLGLGIFSLTSLLMGLGMAIVARNEFRGRDLLRRFDLTGLRRLGRNQLGFMALIVVYCLWSMYQAVAHPITGIEGMEAIGDSFGDLVTELTLLVYGAVIVLTIVFQGVTARYYFARIPRLREYLNKTPDWVLEVQRSRW